ncbi:putative Meiosis specific protein Hop1 [Taphrina deformans PYCC 5710]|uniref:Meiosis specific protein Hop1 n=1 Tax=Taphrina deformans (strain PYCC 5710 / ATCC 11124 / CBS 356.35 / IMI 108563 / JCM 9778 / NBRC 8474) TaxID=1097556 RepID=R4XCU9_TAPDE|nr:putative Meiosis specific protein Hop1 [Taphrina deformans PYCC 5710]|eukprot:CCG83443.1 putative Meiosis specific protein Hop1 [Taphrina deformans PYCC 5710]
MSVVFSISMDPRHTSNIHEAYTFQFAYRANASPTIVVQDKIRGKSTTAMPLDAAKRSMQLLFRQLIAMTQSLSPLPEDANKFIALRLFFREGTPETYQPPGFRAASEKEAARFVTHFEKDRPHDQEIGSIDTGFHACTLRITTIGDLDDDPADRAQATKVWDAEHNAKVACETLSSLRGIDVPSQATLGDPLDKEQKSTATCTQDFNPDLDTIMNGSEFGQDSLVPTQVLEESQNHTAIIHRMTRSQARNRNVQLGQAAKECDITQSENQDSMMRSVNSINAVDSSHHQLSLKGCKRDHSNGAKFVKASASATQSSCNDKREQSEADLVTCECGDLSEDGLMIQCDLCHVTHELMNQGYMQSTIEQGYTHKCYACLIENCDDLENLRSIAIMRRALHMIWLDGYHCTSTREFGDSIGVKDLPTAASILQKLVREKWIAPQKSKVLLKSTRQNKKRPTYTVLRTSENERRLVKEYFDPKIGLDKYTGPRGSVGNAKTLQEKVGLKKSQEYTQAASDFELLKIDEDRKSVQSISQARDSCSDIVCATPESMVAPTKKARVQGFCKTRTPAELVTLGDALKNGPVISSTATTEEEVDEDLSLPPEDKVQPKTALHARNDEALRPAKRVKVSIVNKPVVSYAFDTMSN